MKNITIYTDGSSKGNPGPGGYGTVLLYEEHKRELSKGYKWTTNNRMELQAVIAGLEALKEACVVTVYTDSKYIANAINNHWLENWKKKNWKKSDKKDVLNQDLWKTLDNLLHQHTVTFVWVKGHADNEYNNLCDTLATTAAEQQAVHDDVGMAQ